MILPPGFELYLRAIAGVEAGTDDDLQERLGTFLFWVVALDERLFKLNGEAYGGQKNNHDGGRLLLPAKFARNALAHGSVVAVRPAGLTIPFTIPVVIPPATWRPLGELVQEWPDRWDRGGRAEVAYGDILSGELVGEFMPLVRSWFDLQRTAR